MKKFLFKLIVCVLLPLGLFFGGCEIYFTHVGNSYAKKKEIIENKIATVETIVAGSSHGLHGIDTDLFPKPTLNLSNVSQDIYYTDKLLRKYIDQAPHLKTVILVVSSSTLDGLLELSYEDWRAHFYKKIYGIGRHQGENLITPKDHFYTLIYYDRLFQYLRKGLPIGDMNRLTETGYSPVPVPSKEELDRNISVETGKARAILHASKDSTFHQVNVDILDSLVRDLKSRKIETVLITLPAYKTYTGGFDKKWIDNVLGTYKDIARKNNAIYLNLFIDSRFVKDDFSDNDHLNEKGAKKLTQILIKKLEK